MSDTTVETTGSNFGGRQKKVKQDWFQLFSRTAAHPIGFWLKLMNDFDGNVKCN